MKVGCEIVTRSTSSARVAPTSFKLLLGIDQRGDELKVPRVLWRIVPRSAVPGCLKKTLALKQSCLLSETGVALTTSAVSTVERERHTISYQSKAGEKSDKKRDGAAEVPTTLVGFASPTACKLGRDRVLGTSHGLWLAERVESYSAEHGVDNSLIIDSQNTCGDCEGLTN